MKIKAYICGTDWNTDLPLGAQDVQLYTDLKKFKASRTCYKECGIVEVEVEFKKRIMKGTGW